jgi:hypothetical protein
LRRKADALDVARRTIPGVSCRDTPRNQNFGNFCGWPAYRPDLRR